MDYFAPESLTEALDILAGGDVRLVAGGTDFYPALPAGGPRQSLLDVTRVAGLRGVARTDGGWRIGAATRWSDIARADLPPAFDALKLAAREVGSSQIQTSATIGGNLCNASPAADGVPPLLVLDAGVEIASAAGIRTLPLAAFLTGPRQTALQAGEMLTAILIPDAAAQGRAHFLKLGARKHLLISIAMVAARLTLEGGRIRDAAVSVGSCGPVATRLPALEAALAGALPHEASEAVTADLLCSSLSPIDDIRADRAYRLEAACELLRRALDVLGQEATS